jgi:hypothetical protein
VEVARQCPVQLDFFNRQKQTTHQSKKIPKQWTAKIKHKMRKQRRERQLFTWEKHGKTLSERP